MYYTQDQHVVYIVSELTILLKFESATLLRFNINFTDFLFLKSLTDILLQHY